MIRLVTTALCLLAGGPFEGETPPPAPVLGPPPATRPATAEPNAAANEAVPAPIEIDLDDAPEETLANPVAAPVPEEPAPDAGAGATQGAKEDVADLDPRLHEAVVSVLEKQVEDLKRTANALATRDAESMQILDAIEGVDDELEALGVSSDRATQVRQLSHEVRSLRARLQLMELRAPTIDPSAKSSVLSAPQNEVLHPPTRVEIPRMELQGRSRFPSREAVIAFQDGEIDVVIGTIEGLNLGRVTPEALYAYGSALLERGRFDEARDVFGRFERINDRPTLKEGVARQLERMERLAAGFYTPPTATGEKER